MKISSPNSGARSQDGIITVLFIGLLAIMMIVIMVQTSSLIRLHREVKLLERQQIKRLNAAAPPLPPQTNFAAATNAVLSAP